MKPIAIPSLLLLILLAPTTAQAWPDEAYPEIFRQARKVVPAPLARLLEAHETAPGARCPARDVPAAVATATAIAEFRNPRGDLGRAVEALRQAGCAAARLNDPGPDVHELVRSAHPRFAVVFYGHHPAIATGDLETYLQARSSAHARLMARFARTSELPNRSERLELLPEFGLASIAFSHAVTDVVNVWVHIWRAVNGAMR